MEPGRKRGKRQRERRNGTLTPRLAGAGKTKADRRPPGPPSQQITRAECPPRSSHAQGPTATAVGGIGRCDAIASSSCSSRGVGVSSLPTANLPRGLPHPPPSTLAKPGKPGSGSGLTVVVYTISSFSFHHALQHMRTQELQMPRRVAPHAMYRRRYYSTYAR